ncbi:MAG: ATP-binding protein [Oscillospiraceae bacterium]|nr:ATP-binding protein [Oscillospiraceae bacterium]
MTQITLPARLDRLDDVFGFVGAAMQNAGLNAKRQNNINVAVEEIFVNIAKYAYPEKEGGVTIRLSVGPSKFSVEFSDGGIPYNPLLKADPDMSLSADEREIGGLGIFMTKKLMDHVEYRYENNMNILLVQKDIDTL